MSTIASLFRRIAFALIGISFALKISFICAKNHVSFAPQIKYYICANNTGE
jgi:hypothetical protein